VNAYSNPVIDAKISEKAINTAKLAGVGEGKGGRVTISASLHPDIDRRHLRFAVICVVPARVQLVYVVLGDGGPDHGAGTHYEAHRYPLQRREVDLCLTKRGVDPLVDDGDEDDEGKRVEVGEDVVRDPVKFHCCGLRGEVVGHLVVRQPCGG